MGYYFALLTAFFMIPIGNGLVSLILVALCVVCFLMGKAEEKRTFEKLTIESKKAQEKKDKKAARILTDEKYARTMFFDEFLRFSPLGYHDEGIGLRKKIEHRIVVPVVWESEYQQASDSLVPQNSKKSLDKEYSTVVRGYSKEHRLLAIKESFDYEMDAGVNSEGVPQSHFIYKSQEIVALTLGEEVYIKRESWHVANDVHGGNVSFRYGHFLKENFSF